MKHQRCFGLYNQLRLCIYNIPSMSFLTWLVMTNPPQFIFNSKLDMLPAVTQDKLPKPVTPPPESRPSMKEDGIK